VQLAARERRVMVGSMEMELFDLCAQLQRDAGCKKVLVCGTDGEVLAHAGQLGTLDEPASDAVASIMADALAAGAATAEDATPPELQATLAGGLGACATALGARAALVVIYDGGTTLERVRVKMRRARDRLVRSLPSDSDPTESPPAAS
jgi:predicted regulator of Ras-like GTPase activity (Roadblock/LC7/MglB family)